MVSTDSNTFSNNVDKGIIKFKWFSDSGGTLTFDLKKLRGFVFCNLVSTAYIQYIYQTT